MDSLSPNLFVKDINQTIDFYKKLGFNVVITVPDKGELDWAMMSCGNVTMMFQTFKSLANELPAISRQEGGSLLFYIKIKGIRKFFDSLKKEGVIIIKGLEKAFYGATEFSIHDNNGYVLTFAEDE
ncbi:MAG: glyoxalase [Bacteroidetes bacterium RIFCSPLOWO2_02_FULL_36_8]|nr:MAG: glyoxalase [Bacteroidetes bacterium RIFCSPLOWO2_02_FULL_36_8]OFY70830.1 MAG: glyoxalase [Bacteroidetes bacterium RIFCSPLOWO2_12_FULL_37_12]